MATLPAAQREVLQLLYWDELSVAEIAEVTGAPEGTVKTHLFRGRQALRSRVTGLLPGGAP
jgi:RNA polymerase sigma-70 factor (ECF subfamily)